MSDVAAATAGAGVAGAAAGLAATGRGRQPPGCWPWPLVLEAGAALLALAGAGAWGWICPSSCWAQLLLLDDGDLANDRPTDRSLELSLKARHSGHQALGLIPQAHRGRSAFLDEGSVLLGDLVHLLDRIAHLADAGRLLLAGRAGHPRCPSRRMAPTISVMVAPAVFVDLGGAQFPRSRWR